MIQRPNTQSYRRADLPQLRLVNLFPEKSPASRTDLALLPRPALKVSRDVGTGPIRGIYASAGALSGNTYAVSGTKLYRNAFQVGNIPGTDLVSMAASATQLLIANDSQLRLTEGGTVKLVSFPDAAPVSSVAYINGYFLASRKGSQRFYWSAVLDGSSWDGLDYASAERGPDNIVAIWVVGDQIWIFGENTTEIWVTTGDGEAPFQRVDGRLFDKGCLSKDTIARFDNSILWVGHDKIVYRGDSTPIRVSDHSTEEAIAATDPDQLSAWTFPWMGHLFYCLTTARGTLVFDAATQQWGEFASFGLPAWRAQVGVFHDGKVLAGDNDLGRIWELVDKPFTDDEEIIEARWATVIAGEGYCDNVVLDMSVGEEANPAVEPEVECRVSRDQGMTWSDYRQASMGKTGQYRKRAVFRRFGVVDGDGMMLEFRVSMPTFRRVSAIMVNEGQSGRGRPN